jgi:hypothetical protein
MVLVPVSAPAALILISAIVFSGCRTPTAAEDEDVLANLRFSPGAFDSFRRNTEILYTLQQPARVSFSIVRRLPSGIDQPVISIFTELLESKGYHSHTWLGDTAGGLFAPAGDYIGIVRVGAAKYEANVRVFHF